MPWLRLVILLLLVSPLPAEQGSHEENNPSRYPHDCNRTSVIDSEIENFHQVDDELFRGARPRYDDEVYLKLAGLGVRTIINLEGAGEADREKAVVDGVNQTLRQQGKPTFTFISFPIRSFVQTVLFRVSDQRVQGLFAELQNAPKPMFVHCKRGKDRTGMLVMLYRLRRHEQPSYEEALREAQHYHFSKWNFGLKRTVKGFNGEKVERLAAPATMPARNACYAGSQLQPAL